MGRHPAHDCDHQAEGSHGLGFISSAELLLETARFRVGRFDRRNMMCYELMIDTKGEPGIKTVIEEIENYLRQIRKA